MNRRTTLILALVLGLALPCARGCASPSAAFVDADESTYQSVAEKWDAWVDADASLDADRKAAKHAVLRAWRTRLDEAHKAQGSASPSPSPTATPAAGK